MRVRPMVWDETGVVIRKMGAFSCVALVVLLLLDSSAWSFRLGPVAKTWRLSRMQRRSGDVSSLDRATVALPVPALRPNGFSDGSPGKSSASPLFASDKDESGGGDKANPDGPADDITAQAEKAVRDAERAIKTAIAGNDRPAAPPPDIAPNVPPKRQTLSRPKLVLEVDTVASAVGGAGLGAVAGVAVNAAIGNDLFVDFDAYVAAPAALGVVLGATAFVVASDDESQAGEVVRKTLGGPTKALGRAAGGLVRSGIDSAVNKVKAIPGEIQKSIENKVEETVDAIENKVEETVDEVKRTPEKIKAAAKSASEKAVEKIKETPKVVAEGTKKAAIKVAEGTKEAVVRKVEETKEKVANTVDEVVSLPGKKLDEVRKIFSESVPRVLPETSATPKASQETPRAPQVAPPVEAEGEDRRTTDLEPRDSESASRINVPKIDLPEISAPKIDLPEVKMPKLDLPSIGGSKPDVTSPPAKPSPPETVPPQRKSSVEVSKEEPSKPVLPDMPKLELPKVELPKVELPKPPVSKAPAPKKESDVIFTELSLKEFVKGAKGSGVEADQTDKVAVEEKGRKEAEQQRFVALAEQAAERQRQAAAARAAAQEKKRAVSEQRKREAEEKKKALAEQAAERQRQAAAAKAAAQEEQRALAEQRKKEAEEKKKALAEQRQAEKRLAEERKKTLAKEAAERKREAAAARAAAVEEQRALRQKEAEEKKRAEAEKREADRVAAEERKRALAEKQKKASAEKEAQQVMTEAKPGATIRLLDFFQKSDESPALPTKPATKQRSISAAPKGVPTISDWRQNRDGTIAGIISGSSNFSDGEAVTTSKIKSEATGGTVVETFSGSRYFLEAQENEKAVEDARKQQAAQRKRQAEAARAAAQKEAEQKKRELAEQAVERKRQADAARAAAQKQAEEKKRIAAEQAAERKQQAEAARAAAQKEAEEKKRVLAEQAAERKQQADAARAAAKKQAEEKQRALAAERKRKADAAKVAAQKQAEERKRSIAEQREAAKALAEQRKKENAEKRQRASAKQQAERAVTQAKPGATVSLFGLFQKSDTDESSNAASSSQPGDAKDAPKGVPTITSWEQNPDGSISGFVSGSSIFGKGEAITTSRIKGKAVGGTVVETFSGSRYLLGKAATGGDSLATAQQKKRATEEARQKEAAERKRLADAAKAAAQKQAEEKKQALAAQRDAAKALAEERKKKLAEQAAERKRKADEARAAAQKKAEEKKRIIAEQREATKARVEQRRKEAEEKQKQARAKQEAKKAVAQAKPGATVSLFGLFQSSDEDTSSSQQGSSKNIPKDVATISNWEQNRDGSITGFVSGSSFFGKGEAITTSRIKGKAVSNSLVETVSGSRYFLGSPATAKNSASAAREKQKAAEEARKKEAAERKQQAAAAKAAAQKQAEEKKQALAEQAAKRKQEAEAARAAAQKQAEEKKRALAEQAAERKRQAEAAKAIAQKQAEEKKRALAEKQEAAKALAEQRKKDAAERKRLADAARMTKKQSVPEKPQSTSRATKAPKGVPTIRNWRKNRDGSISGSIFGSPNFPDGDAIETSPITSGSIENDSLVRTGSGSRYFLSGGGGGGGAQLLKRAKPGATISLFNLSPKGRTMRSSVEQRDDSATKRRPVATKKVAKAPRGVPSLVNWRKNRDGSVTGFISGSSNFAEGERVTTSLIAFGKIASGETVRTGSGSSYFLV